MRLLRALDRAFTTFVNEVFPFPVFPSLEDVPDEIVRRGVVEEDDDSLGFYWQGHPVTPASSASGVAGETPVGGGHSPDPADGLSRMVRSDLFDAAILLHVLADGRRRKEKDHDDRLLAIAEQLNSIAAALK